jgi:mycothiol synthase
MGLTPQLRMLKPTLSELPALLLPAGFSLRSYQAGDAAHWDRILAASFGGEPGRFSFDRIMRRDPAFRAERVLFVVAAGRPVATASAWRAPGLRPDTGTVHYVGVVPEFQGHRLGYWVTLATLHRMALEGLRAATLTTDDFRLPAVKTYLRMGFEPLLVHENQRERWGQVLRELKLPELEARFAALLSGPLWLPPAYPEDEVDYARMLVRRRRQHPERPLGQTFVGADEALGDESLYCPALLGRAGASVSEVVAGTDGPFELWFEAGPTGLPTGSEVCFQALGENPLGAVAPGEDSVCPGVVEWHYAGTARLGLLPGPRQAQEPGPDGKRIVAAPSAGLGFVVEEGALAPGERVTLVCGAQGGWRWTPLAGRRDLKVLVNPGQGEPVMRLPEPIVIHVSAGAPTRVEAFLPGSAGLGEALRADVRVTDRYGNLAPVAGRARLRLGARTVALPLSGGAGHLEVGRMGTEPVSCRASVPGLPAGLSNVTVPRGEDGLGLFFGDLNAPAFVPASVGWTAEGRRWAREARRLDFAAVLPQAHAWLDHERWALHKQAVEVNLDEGRLVTFLGFGWQHSHYGDKAVYFLGGDQPYLPVDDSRYAYPARLYEALRASEALVISQNPGRRSGPRLGGTDWTAVEADVERLVELWSGNGSGEGWEPSDGRLPGPPREAGVMGALRAGLRLGFTGGSAPQGGQAGDFGEAPWPAGGGLCAVWAEGLTRRSVFAALRARRTYAVRGRRTVLRFTVNGAPMGAELPFVGTSRIHLQAWAEERIARVDVARDASPWRVMEPGAKTFDCTLEDRLDRPAFYHARVTLADGSLAVCSPVWIG